MAASTSVMSCDALRPSRPRLVQSRLSRSNCTSAAYNSRDADVDRSQQAAPDTCEVRVNDGAAPQLNGDRGVVVGKRDLILRTSSAAMLAAIFSLSGERPNYLGVQKNPPSLALCPPTPTCISTSEEFNDPAHYVPPWSYNPEDGRGRKKPASKEQAMQELIEAILSTKPDNFTPRIVKKTDDYIYVEYESGVLGLVHDVEFWFPPSGGSLCEYRSASRIGPIDFDVNRKRIKALRQALEKRGWQSVGY